MNKEDMEEMLKSVMRSELGDLYVDRQEHFLDHQQLRKCRDPKEVLRRQKNHDFVSAVRQGSEIAKTATVRTCVTAFIGFVGYAAWYYIKGMLGK